MAKWRPATRSLNEAALKWFESLDPVPVADIDADVSAAAHEFVAKHNPAQATGRTMAGLRGVLRKFQVALDQVRALRPDRQAAGARAERAHTPAGERLIKEVPELPEHTRAPVSSP